MRKQALLITTSLVAFTAPAMAEGWLNRMFTFREEQKPIIRPSSAEGMAPKHILAPHFQNPEAREWAEYYTRRDLEPVPAALNSSTMVMRPPEQAPKAEELVTIEEQDTYLNEMAAMEELPVQSNAPRLHIQSADAAPQQMASLAQAPQGRGYMKEQPVPQPYSQQPYYNQQPLHISKAETGIAEQKTVVDNPIYNWKDATKIKNPTSGVIPRPGDFDYKKPQPRTEERHASNQNYQGYNQQQTYTGSKPNKYTVVEGDTLSGISQKDYIYGDWKMWPLIYDANRTQIKDPDYIKPMQRFDIPRDYTDPQANDARSRAEADRNPVSLYDGR